MRHEVLADQVCVWKVRERNEREPATLDCAERYDHHAVLGHGTRLLNAKLFEQQLGHYSRAISLAGYEGSYMHVGHDHESFLYVVASRSDLGDTSRLHQQGRGTELVDGKKSGKRRRSLNGQRRFQFQKLGGRVRTC